MIPSRTLHYCNLPEYSEESWRPEETCHSASSEIPSANADGKNSKGVIIIIIIITVPKGLEKGLENLEIRGKIDTIRNTALLQSSRILRRVLET